MTAHLGPAVTSFVDGQLDHRQRDEVLAHLAHCDPCRQEVSILRLCKAALRGAEAPALSDALSSRLLAAIPTHVIPPQTTSAQRRSGPLRRTAFGASLVALGIGGALSLAGPPPAGPPAQVDPTSVRFVLDHAATAGEVPFTEPEIVSVSSAGVVR